MANEARGYRYGIPAMALGAICSVITMMTRPNALPELGFPPRCIGQDALGDGFNFIDLFWTCPEGFRLSLMSFIAALSIICISTAGALIVKRAASMPAILSIFLRIGLAGLSVGIVYLIGVYFSEFFGGQGKANPSFIVATPVIFSLMHFPSKWGLPMSIPVFAMGFISLVLIAFLTGIPLD